MIQKNKKIENDLFDLKSKNHKCMEYGKFITKYQFLKVSGLKGKPLSFQIQQKTTNKIYDYVQITKNGLQIDKFHQYCEELLGWQHNNILKLHLFSFILGQQSYGKPFCKFFLVFEYSQQTLEDEIKQYEENQKVFKKQKLFNIFLQLAQAFSYLHEKKKKVYGKFSWKNAFKNHQGQYKLIPPNIFHSKNQFFPYSPQKYQYIHCRSLTNKQKPDEFKSESYSFILYYMQLALKKNIRQLYNKYSINKKKVTQWLNQFQNYFGFTFANLLNKIIKHQGYISDIVKIWQSGSINKYQILKSSQQRSKKAYTVNPNQFQLDFINKTFPQQFQDDIQKIISKQISKIQDIYDIQYVNQGNRYQGNKLNNKPNGWGMLYFANGDFFHGHFLNGMYQGQGIYYWQNGMKHYGNFKQGNAQGLGVRFYSNGGIYFGQWMKGLNHGYGHFYWSNGVKYKGFFVKDRIEGQGVLYLPAQNTKGKLQGKKYQGIWGDIKQNGISIQTFQLNMHDKISKYIN